MKSSHVKFYIIGILFLHLVSCGQEEPYTKEIEIMGHWILIEQSGGFTGETIKGEGGAVSIVIDNFLYQEFVHDSLVLKTTYELETSVEPLHGTTEKTLIKFASGKTKAVVIKENNLELIDQYFDGFTYKYKRN